MLHGPLFHVPRIKGRGAQAYEQRGRKYGSNRVYRLGEMAAQAQKDGMYLMSFASPYHSPLTLFGDYFLISYRKPEFFPSKLQSRKYH